MRIGRTNRSRATHEKKWNSLESTRRKRKHLATEVHELTRCDQVNIVGLHEEKRKRTRSHGLLIDNVRGRSVNLRVPTTIGLHPRFELLLTCVLSPVHPQFLDV